MQLLRISATVEIKISHVRHPHWRRKNKKEDCSILSVFALAFCSDIYSMVPTVC